MPLVETPEYAERATASPDYPIRPHHISLLLLRVRPSIFRENHNAVVAFVEAAQRLASWRIPYGLRSHPGSYPNVSVGACAMEKLVVDDNEHSLCTHKFVTYLYLVAPARIL